MVPTVMNRPSLVEHGKLRFLIMDAPSESNLDAYIKEMREHGITDLVRTCDANYSAEVVESAGICMHELVFPDGEAPPESVLNQWLELVDDVVSRKGGIAIHCVAGLGRAPVLVAVALVEKGMEPLDAIEFVRNRRRGAINRRQLQYLKNYRRRTRKDKCCCVIM